jgi:acetyl-CoA carboxylase biotin carboxyl carrier protein
VNVRSPIAGSVIRVCVTIGDKIAVDDEIAIVESMKMEIPVLSEHAGTVAEILVEEKLQVREDDVLVVLA